MEKKTEKMASLMGEVTVLKQDKISPYRKPIDPTPRQRLLDDERVMQELLDESDEATSYESGDELKYLSLIHI